MTQGPDTGSTTAVRRALQRELEERGHAVGADTVGLRGELYVRGNGDSAAALFEFKSTSEEAVETMYQGSWPASMPPRFAVLPASQKDDPLSEMLGQAGLSTLFYEVAPTGVVFADLDGALVHVEGRRSREHRADDDREGGCDGRR